MALRFGKKKSNADDWSDDSLKQELAAMSGQDNPDAIVHVDKNEFSDLGTIEDDAQGEDPLAELLNDPAFNAPPGSMAGQGQRPSIPPPADMDSSDTDSFDDFSPEALAAAGAPAASPASPAASPASPASPPAATPVALGKPADAVATSEVEAEADPTVNAEAPAEVARRRPPLSPILLAAGLVFLVVAVGVGGYFLFFSAPPEDETPPVVPARVAKRPEPPATAPKTATKVVVPKTTATGNAKAGAPKATATGASTSKASTPRGGAPKVVPKAVTPGKAGITAKGGVPPVVAPKTPAQAPRVVPVRGVPTPVLPAPGMAGTPGKGSTRATSVQVVRPVAPLTPSLQSQLRALWNRGAAAKHRGDYDGARRAWQQMLQLRPGHPGVQEAIDKLPR